MNKHDPVMAIQHLPEVIEGSNTDIYAIVKVIDPDPGLDTNSNLFIYIVFFCENHPFDRRATQ